MEVMQIRSIAQKVKENIQRVIIGKDDVVDLLLVALFSGGHVLLEDVPGMGKTLLARSMAKSLQCTFKRIQFTPDLLPSDLSGINFYNQKNGEFEFRQGPIFANILLADEINRATPRTQSSLLECMEEKQVTIDGETRALDRPFMVLATQNPVENQGTFPLPEAQLDRFLMKVKMGYPAEEDELQILKRFKQSNPIEDLAAETEVGDIIEAQQHYSRVHVSDDLMKYVIQLVNKTRSHPDIVLGISPRGGQSLLKAIQVYAILQGRDYVIPDDIKAMAKPVLSHRIVLKNAMRDQDHNEGGILDQILHEIPVPSEEFIAQR